MTSELNGVEFIKICPPESHGREQSIIMQALRTEGFRNVFVAMGTKFGKAAHVDTPVATPSGWKTMGTIKAGDFVFDEHGKPTRVLSVTDPMYDHKCYEVVFSDGNTIIADAEHDWITDTQKSRKNRARCKDSVYKPEKVNTQQIKDTLTAYVGGKPRPNHSIDLVSGPVQFKAKELPVPPYTLGVWLGDGHSNCGQVSNPDKQIMDEIVKEGFEVTKCNHPILWNVVGLATTLRVLGLKNNKHVPKEYLTASPEQRLALLQGLMDTDGTIGTNGDMCFDNTVKDLADAVEALAVSLGIKVTRLQRYGKLYGVQHKMCYRVRFATDIKVFRLDKKLVKQKSVTVKSRRRSIVAVNDTPSVPVCCITVENPTKLFLIGKAFIPTHNSISGASAISTACLERPGTVWRWVAPIYQQAKIGMEYCQKIMPPEPWVKPNQSAMHLYAPDIDSRIEFWHGQHPMSLEGAGVHGYIIDEAAKCHEQVYISAKTTVTMTKGPIMCISTPLGKNWFYQRSMEAKEHMHWAIRNKKPLEQIFLTAPTAANPYISRDIIERARRELPDRLFRQYYLAEFLDAGTVFIGTNEILYGHHIETDSDTIKWIHEDAKKLTVVCGADWAKNEDFTVFTAIDTTTGRLVGLYRFHKVPYTEAVRRLIWFATRFESVMTIRHDKTGVGSAIDDLMAHTDLPHEGVTWTNSIKNEMVARLMTSIEQKQISLPRIDKITQELDQYEVNVTATGAMTYGAPSGKHDDIVSSLMMANAALVEYGDRELEVRYVNEIGNSVGPKDGIEAYYQSLVEDDED